ncbi:MAG: ribonuclease D [Rhodobacteraceae bacterium]|nr:ribonuclease D [Paracoccaceae bacterium]
MKPKIFKGDLPVDFNPGQALAIDTETMGLNLFRDRLCVIQVKSDTGHVALVQIAPGQTEAPNMVKILEDPKVLKIFHYARSDLAILWKAFGVKVISLYCTKIASKLTRTNSDQHGLKALTKELTGNEVSKVEQSSDWAVEELSDSQIDYAISDVENLHKIMDILNQRLVRDGRYELALRCFEVLPVFVELDIGGWGSDLFSH